MKNRLYGVGVSSENRIGIAHRFYISLEFAEPIRENDARNWLQRVIADAVHKDFEVDSGSEDFGKEPER